MSTPELHIVAACADRKRTAAGRPVRLRDVADGPVNARCAAWWRRLSMAPASVPARNLYVGDHWAVARTLPAAATASGFAGNLWVASAGYGLVPERAMLAAYSATFAAKSPDTVLLDDVSPRATMQAWWSKLATFRLRGLGAPRSLAELADSTTSDAVIMVVASPAYIGALEGDLEHALRAAPRIRLLLVTSAPGPAARELQDAWVPTSARLRMSLGGALTSIHTRLARQLLEELGPSSLDAAAARRYARRLAERSPKLPTIDRNRADDRQVRAFIRAALRREKNISYTRLLREYRASGHACEQRRFKELFKAEEGGR